MRRETSKLREEVTYLMQVYMYFWQSDEGLAISLVHAVEVFSLAWSRVLI